MTFATFSTGKGNVTKVSVKIKLGLRLFFDK